MISHTALANMNQVVHRIFRNFLASGEQSKTFEDLGKTKEYICYVLKKKSATASSPMMEKQLQPLFMVGLAIL